MTPPREPRATLLFDGTCNLCVGAVRSIVRRDRYTRIRFGTLQSAEARALIEQAAGPVRFEELPDSLVLVDDHGVHVHSTAVIRVAEHLGLPYSLLGITRLVPGPVRDAAYRSIARNRYRWFGRRNECMAPTAALEDRFLPNDQ